MDKNLLHPVAKPRPLRYELTVKRIGGPGDQLLYKIPDFCEALKDYGSTVELFVACLKTMCVDSLWVAKQEQRKGEDIQAEIDKLEKELAELSGGTV